jgi:NADPH2 dehydrogenase
VSEPQKMSRLGTFEKFAARQKELGINLPIDKELEVEGPLATSIQIAGHRVGNRFAVLPMEGWDATPDGRPTALVHRRWTRFGESGAKLVWGGEAYAVTPEARANPQQLCANPDTERDLTALRSSLLKGHRSFGDSTEDLLIGLQLTHSGRFARPQGNPVPRTVYSHPVLDSRVGINSDSDRKKALLSDGEVDDLIGRYAATAAHAQNAGFDFVDVKACHGYLGHEFLSAIDRQGRYGGSFHGRTRFLLDSISAVRSAAPDLTIGCRLSIFDFHPFRASDAAAQAAKKRVGEAIPSPASPFGATSSGLDLDLTESSLLLDALEKAGVTMICTTAGSPYYNPHIQRPAFYPPSDGYRPPEDPLVGVARQLCATAELKAQHPGLIFIGSGYTYLQEWLPYVGQAAIRESEADLVGLGRMMLSYPQLPRDVLNGRAAKRSLICRTFSDCTTAPRNGLVSGCYPIDPEYKRRPEAKRLAEIKKLSKDTKL